MANKRQSRGRPSEYSPRFPAWVKALARRGLSKKEIAQEMVISTRTLTLWASQYPEFSQALNEGKSEADAEVENALYKRAMGYEYEEIKVTAVGKKTVKAERTVKHIAGDVSAQTLWLKNRCPERWRDVQKNEITGKDGEPIAIKSTHDLSKLDRSELVQLESIALKLAGSG